MTTELSILGRAGDIKLTWDKDDPESVAKARAEIARLKQAGYMFYIVDGSPADEIAAGNGELTARFASEAELVAARSELAKLRQSYEAANIRAANLQDPDIDAIDQQLAELETVNRRVRAKSDRAALVAKIRADRKTADSLTTQLDVIDADRTRRLEEASAKLPVPGLSLDGDTVTLNGVPLVQASTAEQIRTGLAISSALNPKLRVALIRDGSLIDEQGLKAIQAWAEANDTQVFLERVSAGAPVGVVIEDGEVSEIAAPAKPELAAAGR